MEKKKKVKLFIIIFTTIQMRVLHMYLGLTEQIIGNPEITLYLKILAFLTELL